MDKDVGRVGDADQALVASDGAASVSTLPGVDPSRDALVAAVQKRDTLKAAVLDWMDSEARSPRIRTNGQAPMWRDYLQAEDEVDRCVRAIATEARRAETGTGSVHEGAGLKGIAQPEQQP